MPHRWEDVRMTIVRPGPVDQRGACANSIPQDDLKAFSLPSGTTINIIITGPPKRSIVLFSGVCRRRRL